MRSSPRLAGRNLLSALGRLLVHADPLRPSAAIVVLGGGSPARERTAAALFRGGWAPRVVLVRELGKAWPILGGATAAHDQRVRALVEHGVPRSSILVDADGASTTLQELERVSCLLRLDDAPLILVTSPHHSRRVAITWRRVGRGRQPAIVRTTCQGLAPGRWWPCESSLREVLVEYVALLDLALGSPFARRLSGRRRALQRTANYV